MSSDPYTPSTPTLSTLRHWHRTRSKSRPRHPSSSSFSSTDRSHPSTPQDAVSPPSPSQVTTRRAVSVFSEENVTQDRGDITAFFSTHSSQDSLRESRQSLQDKDYDFTDISPSHTQTVNPATGFHTRSDYIMRIPFPDSTQRDSTSSIESQPGPDFESMYHQELESIPGRHPLRNRVNSKSSSLQHADPDGRLASPTKCQRGRAHTHRSDSMHSTASTLSNASRTPASLRIKPKKTPQRGAMNLFKSLSSPQTIPAPEFENIEFDWAKQRRGELKRRARLMQQEYDDERNVVQVKARSDEEIETEAALPSRPRSWELTPQELALRRELEEEDSRRFTYKDHVVVNSSYLSAHHKDIVPYPLAYDKVNLQNDRYSHDLVKQIFSGRPSIHDDISHKKPVTVLDLGCGDGSWIVDAAQSWRHTLFYGLDIQNLHPSHVQLVEQLGEQLAENIRFTYFNFINDKFPYLDEKFDMVRMVNLKWAIPENKWDFVLAEVHRVLKRGGWVEIIDDDFVLSTSPDSALSAPQLSTVDKIEAQFKNMLQARNLPLNTSSKFMTDKLGRHFNAYHEEDFAVTISKARSLSVESALHVLLPHDGMSHKTAKLMGIGFEDRNLSFGSGGSRSRSRSGSVSSAASYSTHASVGSEILVDREPNHSVESVKQPVFQPLGLEVHPGSFIPFLPNALNAHAIRNMQSILACKEAIRANELKKSPKLAELEVKDDLLLEEKRSLEQLSLEWDERQRAFDDAFWEFESAMLKRLCLPHRYFDAEDDDLFKVGPRPRAHRSRSQRGSDVSLSSPTPSTFSFASTTTVSSAASTVSLGSNIIVRFLRVYSGWK